jgi:hypothetical protein
MYCTAHIAWLGVFSTNELVYLSHSICCFILSFGEKKMSGRSKMVFYVGLVLVQTSRSVLDCSLVYR